MQQYLLDTDTCSYIIKHRPISVLQRFEQMDMAQIYVSSVTCAELYYGVARSSSQQVNLPIVEDFLAHVTIVAWDKTASAVYGRLRSELESRGETIGNMDLMIAAHALALDYVLITNNIRHFGRVVGLVVENWVE